MKMQLIDKNRAVLGTKDIDGSQWTVDKDALVNAERISIPVVKDGIPFAIMMASVDGQQIAEIAAFSIDRIPAVGEYVLIEPRKARWTPFFFDQAAGMRLT